MPEVAQVFSDLVTANHILHHQGLLDAFGRISIRNPSNSSTFFIAHSKPSVLVSEASDFVEFNVDGGAPTDPNANIGRSERYIHSEIYKRFPAVNAVVISQCSDVLPFSVTSSPLRPVIYNAGFLGPEVPIWDIAKAYSSGDTQDMLVGTPRLGASLAAAFSKSAGMAGTIYDTISSRITGHAQEQSTLPDYSVMLMRGRGYVVAAKSIEEAVYQAIYAREAARTQTMSLLMERTRGDGTVEGKIDVEGGGKIKAGKLKISEECHYLSTKEMTDTWATLQKDVGQSWDLWKREVERNGLYDNECRK